MKYSKAINDAVKKLAAKANQNQAYFGFYVITNILVLLSYAFTIYKLMDPKASITVTDKQGTDHLVKTAEITSWDRAFVFIAAVVVITGIVATILFISYARRKDLARSL